MSKNTKTNAARILDQKKIEYELIPYIVDENDLSAKHIATQLGEEICRVFKTLVLKGDRTEYFVCVVPGDAEVDLKKVAKITGNKRSGRYSKREPFHHDEGTVNPHSSKNQRET